MKRQVKGNKLSRTNKSNPLISIIVITYNSSKYVLETLESAKAQTYENIELIISDDASTDNTVGICNKWLGDNNDRFARTKLITTKINTGIPANLNRGFGAAQGKWIKGIAGDDKLISSCIYHNLNHISENPGIEILFSYKEQYVNNFSDENYLYRIPSDNPSDFFNSKITPFEQYQMLLIKDRIGISATVFMSKNLIRSVNMFDERFRMCDDYPLWLKLTKAGHKLNFMPTSTIMHRAHDESVYNSKINKVLINPSFFDREELRRTLVYPNIKWRLRWAHYYNYKMSKILVKTFGNRVHILSKIVSKLFLKYLNPLFWLDKKNN